MVNISKLPLLDYQVSVYKKPETGNYVSLWVADDQPIKIVVAVTNSLL